MIEPPEGDIVASSKRLEALDFAAGFRPNQYEGRRCHFHEKLATGGEGGDQHIAELRDRGDCLHDSSPGDQQHLSRLTYEAGGEFRLTVQKSKLSVKFPRPAGPDDTFPALGAMDDFGPAREDDDEGSSQVTDFVQYVADLSFANGAKWPQLVDLGVAQPYRRLTPELVSTHDRTVGSWTRIIHS
jgi:hypothetical protein